MFQHNKIKLKLWQMNVIVSLLMVSLYNIPFWKELYKIVHPSHFLDYAFMLSVFLLISLLINFLLNLSTGKYTYKLIYSVIFLGASSALYFMNQYNILIDSDMVQNIFETNSAEAFDFVNMTLFIYVVFLGFLPLFIILKVKLKFDSLTRSLLQRLLMIVIGLGIIGLLLFISYPNYASIARNQRHLSHKIVPTNFIFASISYVKQSLRSSRKALKIITQDARIDKSWKDKKSVLILILGETARADHFSLNGYKPMTTPFMNARVATGEIINYPNVSSCGTSTAVSLPCIFSNLVRENYSKSEAKTTENLLDFMLKTEYSVEWRDNNTGCKGLCDRADFRDLTDVQGNEFCQGDECYDEVLLDKLSQQIQNNPKSQVIVLHQKGSHGPAYYLRYPQQFKKFTPTCDSNELQSCSQKQVINAYDNTLLYTDYFIDQSIKMLEQLPESTQTALIYMSDHGESLGENNIYLHGTPYFMAPTAQTHVPLIVWLSKQTQLYFGIDYKCLKINAQQKLSHDNYFHSVLGLLHIQTQYYKKGFDIFSECRN
ncbi:MAG: phosphoethanolamine--lipid A transferase [Methylococcales bacterium]